MKPSPALAINRTLCSHPNKTRQFSRTIKNSLPLIQPYVSTCAGATDCCPLTALLSVPQEMTYLCILAADLPTQNL